jgi:predicted deacetylase
MRGKAAVLLLVLVLCMGSSSLSAPAYVNSFGRFAILVHDVSPAYMEELEVITGIIDAHHLQNRTYLFVIPNHGGKMPLHTYSEFLKLLHNLSEEGYHVELHGYDHVGREFDCKGKTAEVKLELGLLEFERSNLTPPEYFIAPGYAISNDALEVLTSRGITVIGKDFMHFPDGDVKPILNREYTWYVPDFLLKYQLTSAEESYKNTAGTFFLSLHPRAANNEAGLEFLKEFLSFVVETGDWEDEPHNR